MSDFITPALFITDYYDSLISQLDIYTEEQIEKSKGKCQQDYLNEVRQKAIDSIRNVQEENLQFYNANKKKFKIDKSNLNEENKLEELKSQLFANRFCFLLEFELYSTYKNKKPLFKLQTVITDFYLSESDIYYMKFG